MLLEIAPHQIPTAFRTPATCPQCAETVKAAAKICRFCRYEFSVDALLAMQDTSPLPQDTSPLPQDTSPPLSEAQWTQILNDGVRKLKTTGYVEDAEALITQLSGTVSYETGGKPPISVRVLGKEQSFTGMYEMVQWTIRELIPLVQQSDTGSSSPTS